MKVYHFSDHELEVGEYFPTGLYKTTIKKLPPIYQEFEDMMELKRLKYPNCKISRLNCIFTLTSGGAEGFKHHRTFLYELELSDDIYRETRNYNVGSHFYYWLSIEIMDFIKVDEKLMEDYWTKPAKYLDIDGNDIGYNEEILVSEPLLITKIVNWQE